MRKNLVVALLFSVGALSCAWAADSVFYSATGDPNLSPDASATPGGMTDVWTCTFTGDSSMAGSYKAGDGSWAFYSKSAEAIGIHTFDGGALDVNQTVTLNFANQGVAPGYEVGINLLSGSNIEFSLYFIGGDSEIINTRIIA